MKTAERSLLLLSDTYYPGWKAFINEREVRILRADYNFRAIPLEAGEHDIQFTYDPLSFKIGVLVSLLTLIGIVAWFLFKMANSKFQIPILDSCLRRNDNREVLP